MNENGFGKLLKQESIEDYTKESIIGTYQTLENFIQTWNADFSRLDPYRAALENAKPDPDRKEPYVLCGFSR